MPDIPDSLEADLRADAAEAGLDPDAVVRYLATLQAGSGKVCPGCGRRRPLSAYGRDSRDSLGLANRCRECRRA